MNRVQKDKLAKIIMFIAGTLSVVVLGGIFLMLFSNGLKGFAEIEILEFFGTNEWNPSAYEEPKYGILSMVVSTLLVTGMAMFFAVPIGIGAASYLAFFAPPRIEKVLKPAIEMLAAIPSVTIGFIGIVFLGPILADWFGMTNGLNALNGAILLAIMALPTIISISEDTMLTIPRAYIEASYALGANRWETLIKIVIPASKSGIIAAVMLGMGRVIGETMAVLMATGNALAMPNSIFSSIQPLTATIAIEMGEVPYDTTHYYSLFALGVILFLMTLVINIIADRLTTNLKAN